MLKLYFIDILLYLTNSFLSIFFGSQQAVFDCY